MKAFNSFLKLILYFLIHLITLISAYLISLFFTSPVICLSLSVWSIISTLPELVLSKFWLIYLLSSIPLGIVFFIIIEFNLVEDKDFRRNYYSKYIRSKMLEDKTKE